LNAAAVTPLLPQAAANRQARSSAIKLGMQGWPDEGLLRFAKQLGVEWFATPLPATQGETADALLTQGAVIRGVDGSVGGIGASPGGPSGPWKEEEVAQVVKKVDAAGLNLGNVMLHSFPNAVLGNSERDRDIEHVHQSIRICGRMGIPVVEYNFYPLRNVEGLDRRAGRGGSEDRGFDNSHVRDQSPLPRLGRATDEQVWERLRYFLKAVVPVAEESHVRLALHPNDPPVPSYRGIAQPFDTIEHWKRAVNFLPSPSNGITLDTGVTAELGANVPEVIHYFGSRDAINHVHFRNVRTLTPVLNYVETFIDEGQTNMLAAMRALHEVGYSRMIVPDHSPSITGDANQFGAWGFALGYMKALIHAVEG
jgi:mannonate dehydratase